MDSLTLTCRGMLSIHKDRSVTCSDGDCSKSRSTAQGLANHACVVVCREPHCDQCSGFTSDNWA